MKLLILSVTLVLLIAASIVALVSVSYIQDKDISYKEIAMENGITTFKEETCTEDEAGITCIENTFIQCNGETHKVPAFTGYTITEKIFVPKYFEKEKVIIKEKKLTGEERISPQDRIKDSDVHTFGNNVRIDIRNAKWRKYIDSNSMDPLIDEGTTTIEVKPKYPSDIKIGDIIAYDIQGYDYAFVHRVVDIGTDNQGTYFQTQGDNYHSQDPYQVRFSQVEGIVVGILY